MIKRTYQIGQSTLTLGFGDLTGSDAEVLVSSDDSYVTMGGGVSAAILRAGGESIMRDAAKKVPGRLGDVIVTTAGSLRAKYVFHAITIGDGGLDAKEVIARATRRCLELVDSLSVTSRRDADPRDVPPRPKRPAKQEQRRKLIEWLGDLDRERQVLEGKLAEYQGVLTKKEVQRVERRLQEVHDERVEMLVAVTPKAVSPAVSVFVSYAHADEKLRKELGKHLSILERQGLISTWHDRMIAAGTEWAGMIDKRLETSRVILLLISSDFVDSLYCYDIEMTRALERHERREALVIPVILRPVVLKGTPFAKLQALPKDARAATEWSSLDAAFVDVTEGVKDALQGLSAVNA